MPQPSSMLLKRSAMSGFAAKNASISATFLTNSSFVGWIDAISSGASLRLYKVS